LEIGVKLYRDKVENTAPAPHDGTGEEKQTGLENWA